ncbi:MAG: hypothetical protein ACKVRP_08670 [Bacteroidota bacterium]
MRIGERARDWTTRNYREAVSIFNILQRMKNGKKSGAKRLLAHDESGLEVCSSEMP